MHVCQSGEEAIDAFEGFAPDIVMLDIGMPTMDGYTTCRRLQALDPEDRVHFVAQTGWGNEDDRRKSAEAGFERHLVKPVSVEDIDMLLDALRCA